MFSWYEFYLLLPLTRINSARSFLIVFLPPYTVLNAASEMAVSELFRQIIEREREVVVGRRARTKHRSKRGPRSAVRDQEKRNDTTRVRFMGNAWREMQRIVQVSRKLLLRFYALEKEINRLEKLPSTRSRLITWNLLNQSAGQYSILLVFLFSSKQMRWKLYSCCFLYITLARMIETKVW